MPSLFDLPQKTFKQIFNIPEEEVEALFHQAAFEKKVLESAGIYECEDCQGSGRIHGKVTRNYTTRAQYEEDIEYPCNSCNGTGTIPIKRFALVWDDFL